MPIVAIAPQEAQIELNFELTHTKEAVLIRAARRAYCICESTFRARPHSVTNRCAVHEYRRDWLGEKKKLWLTGSPNKAREGSLFIHPCSRETMTQILRMNDDT
jgi:hypothetical protein